jgi:methionyl-tRNA synthetase
MARRVLFHSTPIYYVNDVPHAGHAYCTIASDALARARRLRGDDVFFLTGTDEHGQNIERIARERGEPEQTYCDRISGAFRELWTTLDIRYDRFIRTTDDVHRRGVLKIWARIRDAKAPNGEPAVYKGKYAGWYCPRCEAFKTDDEMKQPGNICPDHERPCEWTEEENYFFRLSSYGETLRALIESDTMAIAPESRKNEVLAVIRQGLQDFSISRARVKWGIPIPEDPSHVFYVWVDALSNYVTALGYADGSPDFDRYWSPSAERMHVIGKEIIRFHCLYWPAILLAAGLPTPSRVFAHGWMTKDGRKLSKSTGNIIDTADLVKRYGLDAVRYHFLRETSFGLDWDFTEGALAQRFNSDLANDFGNLVSRALTMIQRYCAGRVPARSIDSSAGVGRPRGPEDPSVVAADAERVLAKYDEMDFQGALSETWGLIGRLNRRIVERAPWEIAKDPARTGELGAFLHDLVDAVRVVALLASPVIPVASTRALRMIGLSDEQAAATSLAAELPEGLVLGVLDPLFPRLDLKTTVTTNPESAAPKPAPAAAPNPPAPPEAPAGAPDAPPAPPLVAIDAFSALDLRTAKIVAAERIKGAKKLLKLQLDVGERGGDGAPTLRQIVSGIAEAYEPEQLVGRTIIVIANLKPAKLMGVESNGMLLAATVDGKAVLAGFERDVPPGTRVK